MDKRPAPFSDEMLVSLQPLIAEAMNAFALDVSYGVALVAAGRKVAVRRARVEAVAAESLSVA